MELLKTLPHRGEFFTEEAVIRAEPYLPDLFALTEKDLAGLDLFPYYAIVRGFCDRKKNRDYAVEHFSDILHPDLKLAWAVMLFNKSPSNPGIVQYLRTVLNSDTQARKLREILGSEFEDFEKRVRS